MPPPLHLASDALTSPAGPTPSGSADWKSWNGQLYRIQAAYEAALPRDDLWTLADFKDADATLQPHIRQKIRSRTRYEFANNPLVRRIVNVWTSDVVAETGPWPKLRSGNRRVDKFIEQAWMRWWEKSNQAGHLKTAVQAEATDGESVGLLISNSVLLEDQHPLNGVTTDVLGLETDRLADPNYSGSNLQHYIDGVHLDPQTRRPLAYDILRAHPGNDYLDALQEIFEADTYDRRQVLHAFYASRPEQHRGVSRYACVLGISGYDRKLLEADLSRQQLRAAFALTFESEAGGEAESEGDENTWWQSISLPNRQGGGLLLPGGVKPTQLQASGEAAELEAFHRIVAGLVAGCFTMPLGRALGIYGAATYPGIRGEMGPYHHEIASDRRQVWEPKYLLPLWKMFLRELRHTPGWVALMMEIGWRGFSGSFNPRSPEAFLDLTNVAWCWPEKELVVDPSREEEATRKKLARGGIAREDLMDAADQDEHDRRCAIGLGFDDSEEGIRQYRRYCAASIHNLPLPGEQDEEEETQAKPAQSRRTE